MTDPKIAALIAEEAEKRWPEKRDRFGILSREERALNTIQRDAFVAGAQHALEASVQAPAVDREAFDNALQQWSGNGSVLDRLIASGVLQDGFLLEREAEARGLEGAAEWWNNSGLPMYTTHEISRALIARAQRVREGNRVYRNKNCPYE